MTDHATAKRKRILVVEDTPGYCELLEEAFSRHRFRDATQIEHDVTSAWAFLQREPAQPDLILLDLTLKDRSGLEFLRLLRAETRLALIPVVMLTTSDNPQDMHTCYASGANGYVIKPDTFTELVTLAGDVCRFWLHWNCSLSSVPEGWRRPL